MTHKLHRFDFTSLIARGWDSFPEPEGLKKQLEVALLAHCELAGDELDLQAPREIKELKISAAVFDQVLCMWHGHRDRGKKAPPPIPLKFFVCGFGQNASSSWVSIELFPGLDNWEVE